MSSACDRQPCLLLIEDDRHALVTTARLLAMEAFRVEIARGGQEGIGKARHLRPDVIVTDVMMRSISGRDVCEQLQAMRETRHIPVIAYTGIADAQILGDLFRLGVRVFAIKPCLPAVIAQEARTIIETGQTATIRIVTGYGDFLERLGEQVVAYASEQART